MAEVPSFLTADPVIPYSSFMAIYGLTVLVISSLVIAWFFFFILYRIKDAMGLKPIFVSMGMIYAAEVFVVGSMLVNYIILVITDRDRMFGYLYTSNAIGVALWFIGSIRLLKIYNRTPRMSNFRRLLLSIVGLLLVAVLVYLISWNQQSSRSNIEIAEIPLLLIAPTAIGYFGISLIQEKRSVTSKLTQIRLGYMANMQFSQLFMVFTLVVSRIFFFVEWYNEGEFIFISGMALSGILIVLNVYWTFFIPRRVREKHLISPRSFQKFAS